MRNFILRLFLVLSLVLAPAFIPAHAFAAKPKITVYKTPTCGCCEKWEAHLRAEGFTVVSKPLDDLSKIKKEKGIPENLQSCHTGVIGNYVIEGHVPASAIKKLLAQKPKNIKGIAVPGMPIGSPGMEGPNPESYDVMSFDKNGKSEVFEKF